MTRIKQNKLGLAYGIALLASGCQITKPAQPNDVNEHLTYQDKIQFETNVQNMQRDFHQLIAPLNQREEEGLLIISLEGGNLSESTRQDLESELSSRLLMPVTLEYQTSQSQQVIGSMKIELQASTCRFNLQGYSVSRQACEQLRNRYVSLVEKSTWGQGVKYHAESSALSTGSVQRLFNDRLKSAEKQSVTGE